MTVSQARRLWQYTLKLGYRAEVHYAELPHAPPQSQTKVILRCRRGAEIWAYCWGHRDWPPLIRYFRDLDRAEVVGRSH